MYLYSNIKNVNGFIIILVLAYFMHFVKNKNCSRYFCAMMDIRKVPIYSKLIGFECVVSFFQINNKNEKVNKFNAVILVACKWSDF